MKCLTPATLLCSLLATSLTGIEARVPNILFLLQDDMGSFDLGWTEGNAEALMVSGNLTALANEGVVLKKHYVHWHCSPTRRTLLSGRLPIHHSELLSGTDTDDLDLRWTWLSDKLKAVGYANYWFGKGHTGYKSWHHMPINNGFDQHFGFLGGSGSYTKEPRWEDTAPVSNNTEYSTDLFGQLALKALGAHDPAVPFFLYLPWQAVHTPYDVPPQAPSRREQNPLHAL